MNDIWSGNPDTDKAWAADNRKTQMELESLGYWFSIRQHQARVAEFFYEAGAGRQSFVR